VPAKLHVGQWYEQVAKNPKQAFHWYLIAGRAGSVDAMFRVGRYFEEGLLGDKGDHRQSLVWYQEAASHGHSESMFRMGRYYQQGASVERSPHEGFKWYLAAAEKGFSAAMFATAICYEEGVGVARDPDKARYWHRRSAEAGNLDSVQVLVDHHQMEMDRWRSMLPPTPKKSAPPAGLFASASLNVLLLIGLVTAAFWKTTMGPQDSPIVVRASSSNTPSALDVDEQDNRSSQASGDLATVEAVTTEGLETDASGLETTGTRDVGSELVGPELVGPELVVLEVVEVEAPVAELSGDNDADAVPTKTDTKDDEKP